MNSDRWQDGAAEPQSPSRGVPALPTSSPIPPSGIAKVKKAAPVTPNRFNRFFSPRSRSSSSLSSSARALRELTSSTLNRISANGLGDSGLDDLPLLRPNKKRRLTPLKDEDLNKDERLLDETPAFLDSSPLPSSPCRRPSQPTCKSTFCAPIVRKPARGAFLPEWRTEVVGFCSQPADRHMFSAPDFPFCAAACNRSSLVAIGDENGGVQILESAKGEKPGFGIPYITFKTHDNAVTDLSFSPDDLTLATASGDQTAKIVDMKTQTVIYELVEHTSSVKQVVFQPGNSNIIATCSRDSVVALWDLRCAKSSSSIHLFASEDERRTGEQRTPKPKYASMYKSIVHGHCIERRSRTSRTRSGSAITHIDPSITAIQFLPNQPHLFITSCDASARLRLWDIRARYSNHRAGPMHPHLPVSTTALPPSHQTNRNYGVSSLTLSTDNARVYSVCKDHTIYVYSTAHLVLGQPPTVSARPKLGQHGATPLYGLRHPSFKMNSFYVRGAVRPATSTHGELLAAGSSDACPVVFPTDERLLRRQSQRTEPTALNSSSLQEEDTTPIYNAGVPLVRGHSREVTSLAWTAEGELVSIGDDCIARVWREDRDAARGLRSAGEGEGRRWGCGFAEDRGFGDEQTYSDDSDG